MEGEDGRGQVGSRRIGSKDRERRRRGERCINRSRNYKLPDDAPRWRRYQLYERLSCGASVEKSVAATQHQPIRSGYLPGKSDARFPGILTIVIDGGVGTRFNYAGGNGSTGEIRRYHETLKGSAVGWIRVRTRRIKVRSPPKVLSQLPLPLVAHAEIQGQAGMDLIIILNKEIAIPNPPLPIKNTRHIDTHKNIPQQKVRHARKE